MTAPQIYIAITILILAIIAILMFFVKKSDKEKKLTPLAGIAFGFVIAGIAFGEDRRIGYSLMGIGIILSVIDMIQNRKKGNHHSV